MTDSKPYRTLCISGAKMSKFASEVLSNPSEYRQIVGALQYATLTRLDIAYSVNQLCQVPSHSQVFVTSIGQAILTIAAPQPGLVSSLVQTSFHGPPKSSMLFQDPA
jgi:hypothetical protein